MEKELVTTAAEKISKLDDLDKKLVEVLDGVMSATEKGKDFVLAELPDVVSQLLLWYGTYGFIKFMIGVGMIILALFVNKKIFSKGRQIENKHFIEYEETLLRDDKGHLHGGIMIYLIIMVPYIGVTLAFLNLQWLKIWIAPKIWLIEYTTQLLK